MIDVILPVWATDSETINVTESAVESLKGAGRLIIIDNGSTIGGGQLREWADVYVRNKTNLGYARAVNQGLNLAGEIVAVANNDIRVSPNWLEAVRDVENHYSRVISGKWGTIHFRMIPYNEPFKYGSEIMSFGRERWCSGSFFVMRNRWQFDENLLNSYDDWDLQYRIRKDRYYTVYTNKAAYQHLDSYTQQKVEKREDNNKRNREHFKLKHGEYPEVIWETKFPEQYKVPWRPFP